MATIKRYATAGGDMWEVRYRQPNGVTSRKRGFTTKRDASVWASRVETSKAEGDRAKVQTVTPHDLRHTCALLAIGAGANVLAVSRMLGHKDPSVTLRVYSDLFASDLDAVAVNLDAKIRDSVQSVCKAPSDRRRKRTKTAI